MDYLKVNGSWKEVVTPFIKVAGKWVESLEEYVKVNGKWYSTSDTPPVTFRAKVKTTTDVGKPTMLAVGGTLTITKTGTKEFEITSQDNITKVYVGDDVSPNKILEWEQYESDTLTSCEKMFFGVKTNTVITKVTAMLPGTFKNVTNFANAFRNSAITHFDFINIDSSKITSYRATFLGCGKLLDFDGTLMAGSPVKDTNSMFKNTAKCTKINIPHLNTSQCNELNAMFEGTGATCIDRIEVEKGATTTDMFKGTTLTSPDSAEQALLLAGDHTYDKGTPCA